MNAIIKIGYGLSPLFRSELLVKLLSRSPYILTLRDLWINWWWWFKYKGSQIEQHEFINKGTIIIVMITFNKYWFWKAPCTCLYFVKKKRLIIALVTSQPYLPKYLIGRVTSEALLLKQKTILKNTKNMRLVEHRFIRLLLRNRLFYVCLWYL